jgi:hypothetical protein
MDRSAFADRTVERGQTILMVALSMTALVAMAALSIDVVTLYVARGEAQHAAEAAALAGAKAFVTSGYTSYPLGFGNTSALCSGGTGLAELQAQAAAIQNNIAGVAPTILWAGSSCNFTQPENPRITIQLYRTGLPLFFARIWNAASPTVMATATAEAYNPSGGPAPIQLSGVKPWLVPNCPPNSAPQPPTNPNCATPYFVNLADGSIANSGSFIGQKITLTISGGGPLCGSPPLTPCVSAPLPNNSTLTFYPLSIPINPPTPQCPSINQAGCNNSPGPYYENSSCFNPTPLSCGASITNPPNPPILAVDDRLYTGFLKTRTDQGVECLIHAGGTGPNQGQDILPTPPITPGQPLLIEPGPNNPDTALASATNISRSDSVVTVPLFDGSQLCPPGGGSTTCTGSATVIGFLQLGVIDAGGNGSLDAIILNAAGCNPGSTSTAVSGGGVSAVPVRLVQ